MNSLAMEMARELESMLSGIESMIIETGVPFHVLTFLLVITTFTVSYTTLRDSRNYKYNNTLIFKTISFMVLSLFLMASAYYAFVILFIAKVLIAGLLDIQKVSDIERDRLK